MLSGVRLLKSFSVRMNTYPVTRPGVVDLLQREPHESLDSSMFNFLLDEIFCLIII